MKRLIAIALVALLATVAALAAACGKKDPSPASAPAADPKEDMVQAHDSFRQFAETTYGIRGSAPGKPAPHQCSLQSAVMMRPGPPKHWVGQLAGPVHQGAIVTNVRVSFNRAEDGTWHCDPAASQLRRPTPPPGAASEPTSAPASEPSSAPTDACALLAAACTAAK